MGQLDAPQSLAPGFVVAMPQLLDPNFARAVVLLASHDEDGAMGFVVNRPLSVRVSEVLEGLDMAWHGPADARVWGGGPVQTQSGWVLFAPERELPEDCREIVPGLCMTSSLDALRTLARRPPRRFRLLLGYAGWGAGQVENEIIEGAWMLAPPDPARIFDTEPEEAWTACYRDLGLDPFSIVPGHGIQ